jgi:hypothetical protein
MSQQIEYLTSLFTGMDATAAQTPIDLVIDELDRWSTSDMASMSLCDVCWAPTPVIIGALPQLEKVA